MKIPCGFAVDNDDQILIDHAGFVSFEYKHTQRFSTL